MSKFVFEPGMPVSKVQKMIKLGVYKLVSGELKPGNRVKLKSVHEDSPDYGESFSRLLK